MKQVALGFALLIIGLFCVSQNARPWADFDFVAVWYGMLLPLDYIVYRKTKKTLFLPFSRFLNLAFASTFFWLFYEWINLYIHNWEYPVEKLYSPMEWSLFSAIAFTSVLPLLVISSRLASILLKKKVHFSKFKLTTLAVVSIITSVAFLALAIMYPTYAFPLVWLVVFLCIDPLNALQKKPSLLVEATRRNFAPWLIIALGSTIAGLCWEVVNFLVHKWIYVLPTWFWELPGIFTFKIVEMPLLGFLGYIPFAYSAFAVATALKLPAEWFVVEEK